MAQSLQVATIDPIHADDVLDYLSVSPRLHLPAFTRPPELVAGTGDPVPETIECTPATLEAAGDAARRIVALQSKMPLNQASLDVLNLAYAILHYQNKVTP